MFLGCSYKKMSVVIKTPKWVFLWFFGHNLSLIWPGNLISVSSYMFSGMENRMGAILKPSDNRVARICISQCPYLCFWLPGIDWKNFWDPPINRVARSSNTVLSDLQILPYIFPVVGFLMKLHYIILPQFFNLYGSS